MQDQKHILIVDDDLDDQLLLEEAFFKHDPSVLVSKLETARELFNYFASGATSLPPRMVVLDYNLPDATGLALIRWIRANPAWQQIPVIIWSTSNAPHHRSECLAAGAQTYFVKPTVYSQLTEMAAQMLAFLPASVQSGC